jgi:Circadian oscillating protein COP23
MSSSAIAKSLLATVVMGGLVSASPETISTNYPIANQQNISSSIQYRCLQRKGVPATVAYTSRGMVELIRWQDNYFNSSEYTPERRCQEVSDRFQQHAQINDLRFISTGVVNNYKAICISEQTGHCQANGLLLTLSPNDNSQEVLRNLFSLEAGRKTGGLLSGMRSFIPVNTQVKKTIDLNEFLAHSPTVDDAEYSPN